MPDDLLTGAIEKEELIQKILAHLDGRKPDISTAILIAANAFHGHDDRNGASYVIHLMQTFKSGTESNSKRIVEILHDLVEDTVWELDDLRRVGFPEHVVRAIDCVTKRPDELYFDFVKRVGRSYPEFGSSYLAIDAKILNLTHNLESSRNTALMTIEQIIKQRIYTIARNYLVEIKRGEIPPGFPISSFMAARPALYDAVLLQDNSSKARIMAAHRAAKPPASAGP